MVIEPRRLPFLHRRRVRVSLGRLLDRLVQTGDDPDRAAPMVATKAPFCFGRSFNTGPIVLSPAAHQLLARSEDWREAGSQRNDRAVTSLHLCHLQRRRL
jgi:hypothetical protein